MYQDDPDLVAHVAKSRESFEKQKVKMVEAKTTIAAEANTELTKSWRTPVRKCIPESRISCTAVVCALKVYP
jgi:hypothetical protein